MNPPLLRLHHLHAFYLVATTGGVRRSAEVLYRASSAVARSVAALETRLDTPLFERKGRGMLLTAAGEAVRRRVARIEAELAAVRDEAVRQHHGHGVFGVDALFQETRLQAAALLAEMRHMPSVAHAMGMSQPAVSSAISRLEGVLGQPLFERSARGMTPTDACVRWAVRFERVLAELRHIDADVTALSGVLQGVVTIGALPLSRTWVLPSAMAALVARHPGLRIRSLESPYEELCAALISGRIDFILGALRPPAGSELAAEPLFEERIALIARTGHPLARRRHIVIEDLARYPWVLSRSGTPLRELLEAWFASHGCEAPSATIETGDLALLRGLLLQSDMLTANSAHQLHYEIESGALVVLPFTLTGMQRVIGVTTRAGANLSAGALALLDEIRRVCGDVSGARGSWTAAGTASSISTT